MYELETWQWVLGGLGAFLIGLSKTGIAGIGILFVAVFANILPARESVGVVLPLLICGDLIAVASYRAHTQWKHLWKLFPWAAAGVVAGFLVMDITTDTQISRMIGAILVAMVIMHFWWRSRKKEVEGEEEKAVPDYLWLAILMGVMAGFTTMVANAAGPVMILYLLAMRLPKYQFMGTAAVYFLVLNLFKVPFGMQLDIINSDSIELNLRLMPFVFLGGIAGRLIIGHIKQSWFEQIALFFTIIAALRLLF